MEILFKMIQMQKYQNEIYKDYTQMSRSDFSGILGWLINLKEENWLKSTIALLR